jgi:hypothetical protein
MKKQMAGVSVRMGVLGKLIASYRPPLARESMVATSIVCGPNGSTMIGAIVGAEGWIASTAIGATGARPGTARASHAASSGEMAGAVRMRRATADAEPVALGMPADAGWGSTRTVRSIGAGAGG